MTTLPNSHDSHRFAVLDGWRAISILLVLATHMLPLGPKRFDGNVTAGHIGMALFFTLSGFLITRQLQQLPNVTTFFIRRFCRIIPLAYVAILFAVWLNDADMAHALTALSFTQNYADSYIIYDLSHFWSLCVEVHFYLFMGLLVWFAPGREVVVLPALWLALVAYRVVAGPLGTISTHVRVDEILSGSMLALAYTGKLGVWPRAVLTRIPFAPLCVLLLVASHPWAGPLNAFRGLIASSLIGHTLFVHERYGWLTTRPLRYLAEISYALYVIHPLTLHGWLGTGPTPIVKYMRRILCFAITFAAAHVSTFYFENRFIAWGKALSARTQPRPAAIQPMQPT